MLVYSTLGNKSGGKGDFMAKQGQIPTRFNVHSKATLLPIHKGYKVVGVVGAPHGHWA